MNSKKARELRKELRAKGLYSEEPRYEKKLTRKMVYVKDKTGKIEAIPVVKETVINLSKYQYRRIKKGLQEL